MVKLQAVVAALSAAAAAVLVAHAIGAVAVSQRATRVELQRTEHYGSISPADLVDEVFHRRDSARCKGIL